MAHFYAEVQGNRGAASRCGSRHSGITADVRGWEIGAHVEISHVDGRDVVRVYATPGSNGDGRRELVAEFTRNEDVL